MIYTMEDLVKLRDAGIVIALASMVPDNNVTDEHAVMGLSIATDAQSLIKSIFQDA